MTTRIVRRVSLIVITRIISSSFLLPGHAIAQTARVSVDSQGNQGNLISVDPSLSADGRFIAFHSYATNLVPGDSNGKVDVFVHDRQTGDCTRISVSSLGDQGNAESVNPSFSADGRFVSFESMSNNLVPGDTNNQDDIFVHDRTTGTTTRVSVDSAGNEDNGDNYYSRLSADGRYVVFASVANNLVSGDTNFVSDVFVHDRTTGATTRVSVSSQGSQANSFSYDPSITADGRFVTFDSLASNLITGDTNAAQDIFVHDRQTGATTRVSVDSNGIAGNSHSAGPFISADGRIVAFASSATNLVSGDTNGRDDIFVHDRQTGETRRVSVDSRGHQANDESDYALLSADGRFVVFDSAASNLVGRDTNGRHDVFEHDLRTGVTVRVSVSRQGKQGNGDTVGFSSVSADGGLVTFSSFATNLVPADTNGNGDVFLRIDDCLGDPYCVASLLNWYLK